jgi:hypothetical protein
MDKKIIISTPKVQNFLRKCLLAFDSCFFLNNHKSQTSYWFPNNKSIRGK